MTPLDKVHPAALAARARFHPDIVAEVAQAVARNHVVVVGMAWNPSCKRACEVFAGKQVPYTYIEYGNYLSGWRRRLALKLWAGWPTFPMVFIGGQLIGGNSDVRALDAAGELAALLKPAA
jgi:glutaredoxin-related protein